MKKGLQCKVKETIEKYNLIREKDRIVLGVSGGPDSMCMLDVLNSLKNDMNFEIVVAHINHQIREESKDDERYVMEYCKKNEIQFHLKSIDIQKLANNRKIGTEEAGRNVRYEFFNEVLEKVNGNKIAVAHNKNDKIETIFMNILRRKWYFGTKRN